MPFRYEFISLRRVLSATRIKATRRKQNSQVVRVEFADTSNLRHNAVEHSPSKSGHIRTRTQNNGVFSKGNIQPMCSKITYRCPWMMMPMDDISKLARFQEQYAHHDITSDGSPRHINKSTSSSFRFCNRITRCISPAPKEEHTPEHTSLFDVATPRILEILKSLRTIVNDAAGIPIEPPICK